MECWFKALGHEPEPASALSGIFDVSRRLRVPLARNARVYQVVAVLKEVPSWQFRKGLIVRTHLFRVIEALSSSPKPAVRRTILEQM